MREIIIAERMDKINATSNEELYWLLWSNNQPARKGEARPAKPQAVKILP